MACFNLKEGRISSDLLLTHSCLKATGMFYSQEVLQIVSDILIS